jgi:pyruvate dehydrogenase E1 component alpha subunit
MPHEIETILRPDGTVEGDRELPAISWEDLLRLYRVMLLTRRLDERMITLQRQGRIGFYIGSIGEEAAITASAFALEDQDWIVPSYRELAALLLRGYPLFELLCQFFGNSRDPVKGRQMPNHYASRELRFLSISSPVGTQIPHATGLAMAAKLRKSNEIALAYFGEGATSQGDFHVAANFAGVFKAPVVFFCRNNHWAISVPLELQTSSRSIAVKAEAYGFEGRRVDGNDVFAVYSATRDAVDKARRGDGPTLIEAVTYRIGPHSTSDDPKVYREESMVEDWKQKGPLRRLKTYLIEQGHWSEEQDSQLESEIKNEIQDNLRRAEKVGPPFVDTIFEDVFDSLPWHLEEQRDLLRRLNDTSETTKEVPVRQ